MKKIETVFPYLVDLLIYLLCFLLVWEGLQALSDLLSTGDRYDFAFLCVSFLVFVLRVKKRWALPGLFALTVFVAYSQRMALTEGNSNFFQDIIKSLQAIVARNWGEISPALSLLVYFLLLLLFVLLVHYWVGVKKQALFLVLGMIGLIAALDSFTSFDGSWPMVRVFLLGMALLAITNLQRHGRKDGALYDRSVIWKWGIPLVFFLVVGTILGLSLEKKDAQWDDPVAFFENKFGEGKAGTEKKKIALQGFGTNASALGGDFLPDDRVVFTARDEDRHYWKMENRSIYTGKGWDLFPTKLFRKEVIGTKLKTEFTSGAISLPQFDHYVQSGKEKWLKAQIDLQLRIPYLPVPVTQAGVQVTMPASGDVNVNQYDLLNSQVIVAEEDNNKAEFLYQRQSVDIDALKKIQIAHPDGVYWTYSMLFSSATSQEIHQAYVALPPSDDLANVEALAREVTKGKETDFEKVVAIVDYLRGSNFSYQQQDIPVPNQDQDYVAQFLFETKRGYCDNFSSAFVVMCRTLGIEARWARGYTGGEYERSEDGRNVYTITNKNAHSWGEVYFKEYGWIPFEPTPSFNGTLQFVSATDKKLPTSLEVPTTPKKPEQQELTPEKKTATKETDLNFATYLKWIALLLGVLLFAVSVLYWKRSYWLPFLWIWWLGSRKGKNDFERAYGVLLKQLAACGFGRKDGTTLRDYAHYIDQALQSGAMMKRLTESYEVHVYRAPAGLADWEAQHENWEKLMRMTIQR